MSKGSVMIPFCVRSHSLMATVHRERNRKREMGIVLRVLVSSERVF